MELFDTVLNIVALVVSLAVFIGVGIFLLKG